MILAHQFACDNKNPFGSQQQKPSRMERPDQQQHIKQEQGSAEDDHHRQQRTYRAMAPVYHHHQLPPTVDHPLALMSQARFPQQQQQQRQRAYSSGHPIPLHGPSMYSALSSPAPPQLNMAATVPSATCDQEEGHRIPPSYFSENHPPKPLAFHAILQAPAAITPKTDDITVTYLNRGQWYVIELTDQHKRLPSAITSTVSIVFHNSAHRRAASNYWKFWLNQQKNVDRARAIDLDSVQSVGIQNIQPSDFDRVTFEWTTHARIYVRFNCLSTDFSRIKGVKGIPLRVQIESGVTREQQQREEGGGMSGSTTLEERSFCKVKLFRDKGAERKSKDDAKQMGKQFERVPGGHLWLMHTQPLPYSVFIPDPQEEGRSLPAHQQQQQQLVASAIGSSSSGLPTMTSIPFPSRHARTMTAPATYPRWEPCSSSSSSKHHPHWPNLMQASAPDYVLSYAAAPASPLTTACRKRTREDHDHCDDSSLANTSLPSSAYKRHGIHAPLYVQTSSGENQQIALQEWTVRELKIKLCNILSVNPERVSDMVWRRQGETSADFLILVDEGVIAHHLSSGLTVTVYYEPMQNGSGRLVLQEP